MFMHMVTVRRVIRRASLLPISIRTFVLVVAIWGAAIGGAASPVRAAEPGAVWDLLRSGGHAMLIRHAIAPGVGDPEDFRLGECSTQRNLSQEGRDQARRIGELFRENGIDRATVLSSQWCRCLETAREMALGSVQEAPFLNSFFGNREQRGPQTETLRNFLVNADLNVPLVLVTHQVNITALTGNGVRSGEMILIRVSMDGEIVVIGSIRAPV